MSGWHTVGHLSRETLGRAVRLAWMEWAREQAEQKPSWLVPWEELDEPMREVDRRIGEAVAALVRRSDVGDPTQPGRRPFDDPPFEDLPDAGTNCADCGMPQRRSPGGETCVNGHGGAPGIPRATTEVRDA